jgi:hypothetical protein
MSFYHNRQARRKYYLSLVAKRYIPAKRADKPDIIFSIFALASENISFVISGTHAQREFAEIFHPYLYPEYIVYNYINKDSARIRQIECVFLKSKFYANEWSTISKAASNRPACINGAVISSSVIELSLGALH